MTAPFISSDKVLHLQCPDSWEKLSQEQLRYTLQLIACGLYSEVEIRTYMLFRFCGIEIRKKRQKGVSCRVRLDNGKWHYFDIQDWQVQDMIRQLDFVNSPEKMGVRLESIHGLQAVDRQLHGVPFIDYLNIEACYQGFLKQKDKGRVEAMARIMYRDENGDMPEALSLDAAEVTGTLFWYYYIKSTFAAYFPNFFKPANGEVGDKFNVLEAFNTQLRALTDGDVTKEEIVKQMDCWRCLTELDAKAREAADFKKRYGNKR